MAAQPLTLVLNRGGLAGLVATSAALAAETGPGPPRVGLVFVDDGRDDAVVRREACLLYTSPSPRDQRGSRMPSSA